METYEINNAIYDTYGERWYHAFDDPVALLRAEHKAKLSWILDRMREEELKSGLILDVGCGGGFLCNDLARLGFSVIGIDTSPESLRIAKKHDATKSVSYIVADAYSLPFPENSFDIVTAMDVLEHVKDPVSVIREVSRVLRPDGFFFFHTFNRNLLSKLVNIKLVEWFIKNTPKRMHVYDLFIRPFELEAFCRKNNLFFVTLTGVRVKLTSITWDMLKTGIVSPKLEFVLTPNTTLAYIGMAKKKGSEGA